MSVIVKIRSAEPYGKGAVSLIGGTTYIVDESGVIPDSQIEDQSNLLDDNFTHNIQIIGGSSEDIIDEILPDQTGHAGQVLATDGNLTFWETVEGVSGTVSSVFGRMGLVVAVSGDYDVTKITGAAPLASPTFTGTVISPALRITTSPTSGYVLTSDASGNATWQASAGAVTSIFTRTGAVVAASGDYSVDQITGAAPLASPAFTGIPTAPTALNPTNSTQIATTAFVQSIISNLINAAPSSLNTLGEIATSLGNDAAFSTTVTNALALKAPLASPTFTGTPAAPTATVGTNTTQLATTAFVLANQTVSSVFGRTGVVSAASGDYSVGQITGAAPLASPTFTGTVITPTLRLTTSPTSGYVLTSDTSGNATWQATSGGTSISQAGGTVSVGSDGSVSIAPVATKHTTLTVGNLLFSTDNTLDIGAAGATRPRNLYVGNQAILADGSSSTPSIGFSSQTGMGFYRAASGEVMWVSGGSPMLDLTATNVTLPAGSMLKWGSAGVASGDLCLSRDAANTLAQRRSANGQIFRIYNTYTDSSNGEWLSIGWSSNTCYIQTTKNGATSLRGLSLIAGGGSINIDSGGAISITPNTGQNTTLTVGNLLFSTDNTLDVGASGATRPRTGYFGTSVVSPLFTLSGRQTYTPTNGTTDRSFDANATTLDEIADVLATLINDLKNAGLLG
jgi:hypothetical protein